MERVYGWTEQGGNSVVIAGTPGSATQEFQQSFNGATVTIYDAGTLNLSTIYDDDSGTSKANPFTADATTGFWHFYAANGDYDINFSGGGITSPFTLGDVSLGLGASGGIPSYTFGSLPNSGNAFNAGRLARVTDTSRGLWMDSGSAWASVAGEKYNVKEFGAAGDDTADDTGAIQAAIDAIGAGFGTVYFPQGIYRVTSTLTIGEDRIHLQGEGVHATRINFMPVANDICLHYTDGANVLFQNSIRDLMITSDDSTWTKTAIELSDIGEFVLEDVVIGGTVSISGTDYWSGANSIGLHTKGRESLEARNLFIAADRPLLIGINPNHATLDADHFHFSDCQLIANANPVVEVTDLATLSNVTFDGYQAWVKGTHGLFWDDATTVIASYQVKLENVRWEQGTSATSYLVYISLPSIKLQEFTVRNCYGGADRKGFYFRGINNINLDGSSYVNASNDEALNIDTCEALDIRNCFWQAGTTASISNMRQIWGAPKNPSTGALAPWAYYEVDTEGRDLVLGGAPYERTISLANDGVAEVAPSLAQGLLFVTSSEATPALFMLSAGNNTVTELSDPHSVYSVAAATATSTNVYWDAANTRYSIENKRGSPKVYKVFLVGSYTAIS